MKKAIILAGGKGTRLSPLTDGIPKPLMPFLGKTLLERIIEKLSGAGIEEILISTMYLPEMIKNKIGHTSCGAHIQYLHETTPLGTAGGLVFAKDMLNLEKGEDIIVISGDCVCDFDISKAYDDHKRAHADATIITSECDDPLEYGIVLSKSGGLITSFSEKPCWSQVNGCRVNSGVYILKGDVCHLVPKGSPFDFSKELFPKMLKMGMVLHEYKDDGYWCDIGNVESYYKCLIDALHGKIKSIVPQKSSLANDSDIKITEPCYICDDVVIEKGAEIGPNVIISKGCAVGKNCEIVGSVLHEGVKICENSRVEGAIICENAEVGKRCSISGGTVVAQKIKLPECSYLPSNSVITKDTVFPDRTKKAEYFCEKDELCELEEGIYLGLSGNDEKESEKAQRIGFAIADATDTFGKVGIMFDGTSFVRPFYQKLVSGVEKGGRMCYDYDAGFEKLARHQCVFFGTDCFVYVYENADDKKIYAKLFNKNALAPSRDFERRLRKSYKDAEQKMKGAVPKYAAKMQSTAIYYYSEILNSLRAYTFKDGFCGISFAFTGGDKSREFDLLKNAFSELGGNIADEKYAVEHCLPVVKMSGSKEITISQGNYTLDKYHMGLAVTDVEKKLGKSSFAFPYLYPTSFSSRFSGSGSIVFYPIQSVMRYNIPADTLKSCYYLSDDILLAARFMSLMTATKKNISQFYFEQPVFSFREKTVYLPDGTSKTAVIKRLSSGCEYGGCDKYEGIKLEYPEGNVTVVPGKASLFKIYSESRNAEIADSLCEQVEKRINDAARGK